MSNAMQRKPFLRWDPEAGGDNSFSRIGLAALVLWAFTGLVLVFVSPQNGNGAYVPAYYGPGVPSTTLFLVAPYLAITVPTYLLATKWRAHCRDNWSKPLPLIAWWVGASALAAFEWLSYVMYCWSTW
jgi:hypothetical protein